MLDLVNVGSKPTVRPLKFADILFQLLDVFAHLYLGTPISSKKNEPNKTIPNTNPISRILRATSLRC